MESGLRSHPLSDRTQKAIHNVNRVDFVPPAFRAFSDVDRPLPLGDGQTLSQPSLVAYMTDHLNLKENAKVLEIGTGSGYQTAILAELANTVYTIEVRPNLAERAEKILRSLGYNNIEFRIGDGKKGWKEVAPFDGILATAAPDVLPPDLLNQLSEDGILVIPVGTTDQQLWKLKRTEFGFRQETLLDVRFVPMIPGSP